MANSGVRDTGLGNHGGCSSVAKQPQAVNLG